MAFNSDLEVRYNARLMREEIAGIITRMSDKLVSFTATRGRKGADLRTVTGDMKANVTALIMNGLLADKMLASFTAAVAAGITVPQLDPVIIQMRSENPDTLGALWTAELGIFFALSSQCEIISKTMFESRDDIEEMQDRMKASFDLAKDMAADEDDNLVYLDLVDLSAKLARFLAETAMPLPNVVYYHLGPMPALAASYRIYSDASRYDEIIRDNKVVHPAFCRGTLRALSKAPS